jgi:hypothetical protein
MRTNHVFSAQAAFESRNLCAVCGQARWMHRHVRRTLTLARPMPAWRDGLYGYESIALAHAMNRWDRSERAKRRADYIVIAGRAMRWYQVAM